jgi:hypothetical protein
MAEHPRRFPAPWRADKIPGGCRDACVCEPPICSMQVCRSTIGPRRHMGVTAHMILLTLSVALTGCASADPPQAPVPPAATPPPAPSVWYKAGATQEEFQRTRARCLLQAGAGTANFDFEPVAFVLCMRAEGWVRRQPDVRPQ